MFLNYKANSQVSYTANDVLTPYEGYFRQGVNPGYYGPKWDDSTLGDIAAGNTAAGTKGVGVKAIRGSLPESIGLVFGYDIWKDKYEYNQALGLTDNTLFLGFAHPDHKDPVDYCPGDNFQTDMFANLYEPIWDPNFGTAINEENYYAAYVYEVVSRLKDHVKFWEIWNEPGFDFTGAKGWLPPGAPGNWWDNNPDPCDYKLRAPVFHYIRLLRISYDVIKSLAPDDYIVVAGVGYDSFLDVILRNTDNPVDGSVTAEYPLKGGAYFEVLGFHAYPHFDGSTRAWNNDAGMFDYFRHTDAAIEGLENRRNSRQSLLAQYGYDGITYPKKEWTVTEINVPRKPILGEWGSQEVQRNYMIKAVVKAMELEFVNIHIYNLAEIREEAAAGNEFDLLGFYKNLNNVDSFDQEMLDSGVAYKTVSDMLFETVFDEQQTAILNLPNDVRGGAFRKADGSFVYVLWARTSIDKSEEASADYSFPSSFNGQTFALRAWDHSSTNIVNTANSTNITLNGSPIFLVPSQEDNTTSIQLDCAMGIEIIGQASETEGGAIVSWDEPTATTDCATGLTIVQSIGPANGGFFPFGVTEVQYKVTNSCGDEEICAFNVKVASNGGGGLTDCHIYRWNLGFMGAYNGHKYFLSINKATWVEAQAIAASHGGYLASIDDAAENEFIKGQAYNLAYIGLNDKELEGNLTWPSGSDANYTNIADCQGCANSEGGDFAILNYFNGTWYFVDGSSEEHFIVELPCGDTDVDDDGFNTAVDCDDNNPNINPGATEIPNNGIDEDCNGSDLVMSIDEDDDGFNSEEDCDDNNPNINPDAIEIVNNNIDEDCDGIALIIDEDGDGFNSDEDCDDLDGDINPNAEEIANNNIDEDCDGIALVIDEDEDGYNSDEDCDDSNADVNPAAEEVANNDIDEDCDGVALIIDEDGDGYNSDEDCNDSNADVNPAAEEIANNDIDENCDGVLLIIDTDGDGFNSDEDCNDGDPNINPDAEEIPNNDIDEDCDGVILIIDEDGDGYNSDEDCDEANADVNPGAPEIPYNGFDDDCNEETLDDDLDQDGFGIDKDCNDMDALINPDAFEIPGNGIDEDCDGVDGTTTIQENSEPKFSIYPNPHYDSFVIESSLNIDNFELIIFDVLGNSVYKNRGKFSIINSSNWPAGTYYLKLMDLKTKEIVGFRKLVKM